MWIFPLLSLPQERQESPGHPFLLALGSSRAWSKSLNLSLYILGENTWLDLLIKLMEQNR